MPTHDTTTLTVTIDAPVPVIVDDLADPMHHPEWAQEFFAGPARRVADGEVEVDVPMMGGPVRFSVVADRDNGLVDLYLAPKGAPFGDPVPVRVIPNGSGSDVLWTLTRPAGAPDAMWEAGLMAMDRELAALRRRLS